MGMQAVKGGWIGSNDEDEWVWWIFGINEKTFLGTMGKGCESFSINPVIYVFVFKVSI